MPCTTILVGKKASYDGSTIVARNEDSPNGQFEAKRFVAREAPKPGSVYESVLSHLEIELPEGGTRYTAMPNADLREGLWEAAGFNEHNVGMSATETLTSNERVLAADPLVEYRATRGKEGEKDFEPERLGGIGEEDMVTLVLPYATSARNGVERLGELLERYGTYEMNGIAFSDADEIWWLETVGGHHWIARRVPDDCYVTMPNQLGIDDFDLTDAFGEKREHLCSADLREWMDANHLDLTLGGTPGHFNPRDAFGSHSDSDHVYNTPRAWDMQRFLSPHAGPWESAAPGANFGPESNCIPWCRVPERKVTIEAPAAPVRGREARRASVGLARQQRLQRARAVLRPRHHHARVPRQHYHAGEHGELLLGKPPRCRPGGRRLRRVPAARGALPGAPHQPLRWLGSRMRRRRRRPRDLQRRHRRRVPPRDGRSSRQGALRGEHADAQRLLPQRQLGARLRGAAEKLHTWCMFSNRTN